MSESESYGGSFGRILIPVALAGLVLIGLAAFRAGPPPDITVQAGLPGIGKRTPVHVRVAEPKRGLSDLRVELQQGERVELLRARSYTPLESWQFWGTRQGADELTVEVGTEVADWLSEGEATIRVVADRAGAWLRWPSPAVHELTLPVKLRPPTLQVLSSFTYVTQGGSEAVVYQVGQSAVRDGVRAGDWWFPGYPLPGGGKQQRFALFGAPYDLNDPGRIELVAVDDVGNEARTSFVDRFTHRPLKGDQIRISDSFLDRVVPALMAQTPELRDRGNNLDNYLAINGELRGINNATLLELAADSKPEFLWDEEFLQMRNAKVMSDFADRRIYYYQGREVDRQDHLGFDLASVRQADIQAAGAGVILLARYFGIYGNTVVIDHGYGLMSLYGHLSNIAVQEGQTVERGEVVGKSGQSGLAGGDHLHFSMLLQGLSVDPREWWDSHWIQDRLALKLGDALPFD